MYFVIKKTQMSEIKMKMYSCYMQKSKQQVMRVKFSSTLSQFYTLQHLYWVENLLYGNLPDYVP